MPAFLLIFLSSSVPSVSPPSDEVFAGRSCSCHGATNRSTRTNRSARPSTLKKAMRSAACLKRRPNDGPGQRSTSRTAAAGRGARANVQAAVAGRTRAPAVGAGPVHRVHRDPKAARAAVRDRTPARGRTRPATGAPAARNRAAAARGRGVATHRVIQAVVGRARVPRNRAARASRVVGRRASAVRAHPAAATASPTRVAATGQPSRDRALRAAAVNGER